MNCTPGWVGVFILIMIVLGACAESRDREKSNVRFDKIEQTIKDMQLKEKP